MWQDLSYYFTRFKNLKPPKEFKKATIQKVIKECTGIIIETVKINFNKDIIFLSVSPLYKSEILLQEEKIKEALLKEGVRITRIT